MLTSQRIALVQPPKFTRPPISTIKPIGWAYDQGRVQAEGLAGHLYEFGSYVHGSIWVEGGSIEYSSMHEAAPYWFNGMVALAFQINDSRLISQVRSFLDWTLAHQGSDGWLGPEPYVPNASVPRLVWPRYLVLLGMIQYAEADPSQASRIITALHKFAALCNTLWKTNQQGTPSMGFQFDYQYVRWEELVYSLQWLYDNAPQGKESQLLETMQLVRNQGYSWKDRWFTDAAFPKVPPSSTNMQTHGVNTAEALKSEALAWRFTNDQSDIQSTINRLDMLYKYHGQASGTFAADEHMAGLDPSRGTELCAVVEQIFSLATVYSILGNNSVADRVERLAYNALPATMLHDWTAHQYDQQVNQIWAQNMNPAPWGTNSGSSNIFGFEPNYPCCTVNHPQGYPKFWYHTFLVDKSDASLVHALLGPASFSGEVANGNKVTVIADTLYPFGLSIKYTITASQAFKFKVRIPEWAKNGQSQYAVDGGKPTTVSPDGNSFQVISAKAGTTSVIVTFSAPLKVETRYNKAVSVSRGPLLYALELSYNDTVTTGVRSGQALNDVRNLYPNAPAEYLTSTDSHTKDHKLLPTTEWRLAIDPSTIAVTDTSANTSALPFYAWAPGSPPVSMSVTACQISWGLYRSTASAPPTSPVKCEGPLFKAKLVPFGAAKLRLGEIPTMQV
ncbi:hypothetical protein CVT24_001026 [Panaeolus cyanescens]|uniref:Non-reducing end beta-L-arabinofuranosidase-like GH127 middle domain-containing protein n=1 Tax=Panaeolus cyanescens TaxID=181874 RepID=A0A409YTH8_9AGAR|nr:hypothetical protein CVT24_001026 [Panaeolus cyanescens]